MSKFELSEFKNLLNAASEQRREHEALLRRATISHETQRVKNRRAVAEVLEPFLSKAGLDLDKMNKVLAHNQDELRRNFQKQKNESAKHSASQKKTAHRAIELGHEALEHLGNRPAAVDSGLSSLISLTTPFFISEWPQATPELRHR